MEEVSDVVVSVSKYEESMLIFGYDGGRVSGEMSRTIDGTSHAVALADIGYELV